MLSYYQYSIILETFHFDSNNMFPFGFLFKKMVQTLHHLLPSGNNYSQKLPAVDDGKEIETYHILKHWKTCWPVEVFEVLSVSIQYFVSIFHPFFTTTNLSKNESYFFCIFDVLLLSALCFLGFQIMVLYQITVLYKVLYVPNKWWCCTTHDVPGPNHGAGPHQYVELHSGYHHFPYGLLKAKKVSKNIYQKISRNLQKPKTN